MFIPPAADNDQEKMGLHSFADYATASKQLDEECSKKKKGKKSKLSLVYFSLMKR